MRIVGSLVGAFAGGVVGFFAMLALIAFGLLCWACGTVAGLFLLAALWQGAMWMLAGDPAVGWSALGCLGWASVWFAGVVVLIRAGGMLREMAAPAPVSMERVGRLRLAR